MREHKYIVVDEETGKPMVFYQEQFVFVNRFHRRGALPMMTYTDKQFKRFSRMSKKFRRSMGFYLSNYRKIRITP